MLKVALLGLGGVAERIHLPAIRAVEGLDLVSACEVDEARRRHMEQTYSLGHVYPDADALFAAERPDLVIIGTPPDSHRDLCLLSLQAGAHVFCEKPFVQHVSHADEVIAGAEAQGRLVAVNNQYRYMRMYAATREHLVRGEFGRPFLLQCWEQMHHPPSKEKNWRAALVQSTLFEFGTHVFDLACFLFDAFPVSITTHIPRPFPSIAADVVVTALLRFPNEAVATVVLNRVSHAPERYLEMRLDCERASVRMSLGGVARASLDWSKALGRPIVRGSFVKGGEARVESGGRSRVLAREPQMAFASATARNLSRFVGLIQSGSRDYTELRYARNLIRLVFAGYESADIGQTVHL